MSRFFLTENEFYYFLDVLAPPKSFPTPVAKYTLCEMSITWQMYGGHDFKAKDDPKREVRFTEVQLDDKVAFSHVHRGTVTLSPPQNERTKGLSWVQRGGADRDHLVLMELQLNKVGLQSYRVATYIPYLIFF